MKHLPSEKYNVAWFKLAECVARGEKEKALGVYRLLIHSLEDPALICQLEGDLLLSFKDLQAVDKYIAAASLYQKNNKLNEAAALYEHVVSLVPDSENYLSKLIDLYQELEFAPAQLYQRVVLVLLGLKGVPADVLLVHTKKALDALAGQSQHNTLHIFLAKIQALNVGLHGQAVEYLKQIQSV